MRGYDKLKNAVINDCTKEGDCGCFNENGCDKENQRCGNKRCFQNYCDKFKWVIDRAKYYGQKLDMDWMEILDIWEEQRSYWYMNYYNDCNQPEFDGNVRVFDTQEDLIKAIPSKKFRCPCCGGESSNPYECDSGKPIKRKGGSKPCDWKAYGLFGTMGKGITIICKKPFRIEEWFMPIDWEESAK